MKMNLIFIKMYRSVKGGGGTFSVEWFRTQTRLDTEAQGNLLIVGETVEY